MHANGARVVIAGKDADKLEAARRKIGEDVLAVQVDVKHSGSRAPVTGSFAKLWSRLV